MSDEIFSKSLLKVCFPLMKGFVGFNGDIPGAVFVHENPEHVCILIQVSRHM